MILHSVSYSTTGLEDWVTNFYSRLKIFHPEQISETYIARVYDIYIHRKPRPAHFEVIGRYRGITVDSRETPDIQREMFFHELCHILRHAGNQSDMSKAFRELQEWDSRNFVRYAAIPQHMLHFLDLDHPDVIEQMMNIFKVSSRLCEERLEQIKKRSKPLKYIAEASHTYEYK